MDYAARELNLNRLAAVRRHAGRTILDVGCGNGAYVLTLADEYDIRGVDIEEFDQWRQRPDLFQKANICTTDFLPDSVETILCFEVLEHLPDPVQALRKLHRACTKNVIATVPNCEITPGMRASTLAFYHYTDPTHCNFFTLDKLGSLFEHAGFSSVQSDYINEISLLPIIDEAFDLSGLMGALIRKQLQRRLRHVYNLSCLIVANK